MFDLARTGRPKKPKYRSVRLRFSQIEDKMLSIIDSLNDEKDKKLVKEILEQLKPTESVQLDPKR